MKNQVRFLLIAACSLCMLYAVQHNYCGSSTSTPRSVDLQSVSICRNNSECSKFHRLMSNGWPPAKPRGVVVMLISRRAVKRQIFREFAQHFDKNFNDAFQYPLILFHESHLNASDKKLLRSWTRSTVFFQLVKFVLPSFIDKSRITQHCYGINGFGLGYRHMCRFHVKTIYEEPILASDKLEYIWRLDDDSVFTKPMNYDIFRFMKKNTLQYGYVIITQDMDDCIVWLEETVRWFFEQKLVLQKFSWKKGCIFYNNFEISDIRLWRSAGYIDFINHIDAHGGIYTHRWGDAPIKSLAVSFLVPQNKTHHFNDIGYRHQDHENIG